MCNSINYTNTHGKAGVSRLALWTSHIVVCSCYPLLANI